MSRPYICGKDEVKIPHCSECEDLEERVQALEDDTCCEDTRAIVDDQAETINTMGNEILVLQETVSGISGMHSVIVDELPEEGETNVIYLVGCSAPLVDDALVDQAVLCEGDDSYTMWLYTDQGWAQVGGGEIDLSGYVTTEDLQAAIADFITQSDLDTAMAGKQDVLTATAGIRISNNEIERVPLVGEIVETESNIAPSYYGNYQLVDKNMAYRYLDSGMTWAGATSNRSMAISIRDKSIVWRLGFDAKITDSGIRLCRIPFATLGLSGAPNQHVVGYCDGTHQVGMFSLYTDGNDMVMDGVDAVPHTGDAKETWYVQFAMLFGDSNILDSACDRFYWKRTL